MTDAQPVMGVAVAFPFTFFFLSAHAIGTYLGGIERNEERKEEKGARGEKRRTHIERATGRSIGTHTNRVLLRAWSVVTAAESL
ncbi:hypothetical protein QBC45DRAFT_210028 [Copromyces sp. CBS 386.78]|nr:hypothetical protein QBC45DRAFT_210028 [Copromyces sp. CBS 386.78]